MIIFDGLGADIRYTINEQGEGLCSIDDICKALDITDQKDSWTDLPTQDINGEKVKVVSERTLHKLITASPKPEAKAYLYWITHGFGILYSHDGRVLFEALPVAKCLGYNNPQKAVRKYCRPQNGHINKRDLNKLVAHSKLSNAQAFKRWVLNDLVPALYAN